MNLLEQAKNYVSEKVSNMPTPEATVDDVDMKGFGFSGITLLAKLTISNPYSVSIPICDIKYSVKSAAKEIACGTIPDPGSIKANDKTALEVTVKIPHGAVVSLMKDIGSDWDLDYILDLGLIIDLPVIGNFTIPLSYAGEVKLPTLSDMIWGKSEAEETKAEVKN